MSQNKTVSETPIVPTQKTVPVFQLKQCDVVLSGKTIARSLWNCCLSHGQLSEANLKSVIIYYVTLNSQFHDLFLECSKAEVNIELIKHYHTPPCHSFCHSLFHTVINSTVSLQNTDEYLGVFFLQTFCLTCFLLWVNVLHLIQNYKSEFIRCFSKENMGTWISDHD